MKTTAIKPLSTHDKTILSRTIRMAYNNAANQSSYPIDIIDFDSSLKKLFHEKPKVRNRWNRVEAVNPTEAYRLFCKIIKTLAWR